jgi:hypothetical protein
MMDITSEESGNAKKGSGKEKKRLSNNPVKNGNEKLNPVELFAREQMQRLFGKVKMNCY